MSLVSRADGNKAPVYDKGVVSKGLTLMTQAILRGAIIIFIISRFISTFKLYNIQQRFLLASQCKTALRTWRYRFDFKEQLVNHAYVKNKIFIFIN